MTDIVKRLLAPDYWFSGSDEGHEGENDAPFRAAAEITRLRNELHAARVWAERAIAEHEQDIMEITRLRAENEKLRAALRGVVRVADRDTAEFNEARAALKEK